MADSDNITDDNQLLAQYAAQNSEAAFTMLVGRHIALVYSTALRHTGQPHAAEEITQAVFIILARKAKNFSAKTILSGWLYQTTRLTAANYLRTEKRRQQREQEAYMQSLSNETSGADEAWTQIAPLLDDALARLGARDRDAVVLRFFENKSAREIAAALRVEEAAAHKRVTRAIEKLRKFFVKRGVAISGAAISGAVSANSVQAAPVALVKTISAVAIAKGAAATASTLTLVKGALKIMAWTKTQTAIVIGAGILLVAGTATVAVVQHQIGDGNHRKAEIVSRMQAVKMSVIPAMLQYANEHQDEIPANMSELKQYLPATTPAGMDDEHWEILASGKLTPQLKRNDVVLLQEKNVPIGQPKIIGYTDGHFEYRK